MRLKVVSHKNESGAIFLAGVMIVVALGVSMGLFSWYAIGTQTRQARKINAQYQYKAILESVVSRVVDDLRIAKYYPEAQGLPNPPQRPAAINPRCPTNRDLDQYLADTCQDPVIPINLGPPAPNPKNLNPIQDPCPAAGAPPGSRCFHYDITSFNVPVSVGTLWGFPLFPEAAQPLGDTLYIVPEAAPQVTLTKLADQRYLAVINVSVCRRLVVGRGSPPQPGGIGGWMTMGNPPAWTVACPAGDIALLESRVFINTNVDL